MGTHHYKYDIFSNCVAATMFFPGHPYFQLFFLSLTILYNTQLPNKEIVSYFHLHWNTTVLITSFHTKIPSTPCQMSTFHTLPSVLWYTTFWSFGFLFSSINNNMFLHLWCAPGTEDIPLCMKLDQSKDKRVDLMESGPNHAGQPSFHAFSWFFQLIN